MKRPFMIVWATAMVLMFLALAGCGNGGGTNQDDAVVGGGTGKALVLAFSQPG